MRVISKQEARALGKTHFFTGIPCKNGHVAKRRVDSGSCVPCRREAAKRQYDRIKADPLLYAEHIARSIAYGRGEPYYRSAACAS